MTIPIDITDPRIVKAYAHPLRIRILGLLDDRVASPSEISMELGTPLSRTSYHVRQLLTLGLLELVSRMPRRGAIEHYYTATVRPTITDEGWAKVPQIVKRALVGGGLQQAIAHIVAGAEEGGFDRDDAHYTRTAGRMDPKAWKAVAAELTRTLKRVEKIVEESEARVAADPDSDAEDATVIMLHFAGPSPTAVSPHRAAGRSVAEHAASF